MKIAGIQQIILFCRDHEYRVSRLRSICGIEYVYGRPYGVGILMNAVFRLVVLALIVGLSRDFVGLDLSGLFGILFWLLLIFTLGKNTIRVLYVKRLFTKRVWDKKLSPQSKARRMLTKSAIYNEWDENRRVFVDGINSDILQIDEEIIPNDRPVIALREKRKADYKLYDVVFDLYRRGRGGRYKAREGYYTVFHAKLQRPVPHLVFDNKKAKGRQFKHIYLDSQRLSLDANFDDYFTTYSPKYHQIETLSFITPEVLEAMIGLKNEDVEFLDDHLFCYAPLLSRPRLVSFRRRCFNLHAKVNDNLRSYGWRQQETASFARRLAKNPLRYLLTTLACGGFVVLVVWLLVFPQGDLVLSPWNVGFAIVLAGPCGIMFVYYTIKMLKEHKYNRCLEAYFIENKQPATTDAAGKH